MINDQVGAQTVTQINEVCRREGYSTIVCCTDDDPEAETQAIQRCLNLQADGMVIIPCTEDKERYLSVTGRGIPVVLCTRTVPGWPFGSVYVKHDLLIRDMAAHLAGQGFEKVRFLVDVNRFHKRVMSDTFQAQAKELFGMDPEESVELMGRDPSAVTRAMDRFMEEYKDRKRAVFAVNTNTLFLVLKYLEERHIPIPDGMGVCGYDVIGWSELVSPGVTSIRQPMDRMGHVAGEKILSCLKDGNMGGGTIGLDGILNIRASTLLK